MKGKGFYSLLLLIQIYLKRFNMDLLWMDEIQKELGVSRKTVYTLLNSGDLDKYVSRIGGRYATTKARLNDYLDHTLITKKI